jgi:hypothetical protein
VKYVFLTTIQQACSSLSISYLAGLLFLLFKSYGLQSLGRTLKANKPAGVTDEQIDRLFRVYEEVW